eukprot:3655055-Heterocapsa_arctica.AAC.1
MKIVATPFLSEDMNQSLARKPLHPGSAIHCPWYKHSFQAESKTNRPVVAVCLCPHAINGEGYTQQPCSDSTNNCAVCDGAIIGRVQTLTSSEEPTDLAGYAAA